MNPADELIVEFLRQQNKKFAEAFIDGTRHFDEWKEIPDSFPLCRYRIKYSNWTNPDAVRVTESDRCKLILTIHNTRSDLTLEQIKGCFVKFYEKHKL